MDSSSDDSGLAAKPSHLTLLQLARGMHTMVLGSQVGRHQLVNETGASWDLLNVMGNELGKPSPPKNGARGPQAEA